jgi:hypothetical protein
MACSPVRIGVLWYTEKTPNIPCRDTSTRTNPPHTSHATQGILAPHSSDIRLLFREKFINPFDQIDQFFYVFQR